MLHLHPPQNLQQVNDIMYMFAGAGCTSRSAVDCTLNISPGALGFHCDMVLNIPLIEDFQLLYTH